MSQHSRLSSVRVTSAVGLEPTAREAVRILVRGQVQGVGFRPFVARLARRHRLGGLVRNTSCGVAIDLEGLPEGLEAFRDQLLAEAPALARVDSLDIEPVSPAGWTGFEIAASGAGESPGVRVPRDVAVCSRCLEDVRESSNRRHGYPFANCTDCGPRYSIVEAMPYDRSGTSMQHFLMCEACRREYDNVADRRFHAQPNACAACGPRVTLWDRHGVPLAGPEASIARCVDLLRQGRIVALKALGGFQLLVRADQVEAVQRLRDRKRRPSKPLAVMVPSSADAEQVADLGPLERRLLCSPENPIVLVKQRPGLLAEAVSPHLDTVGLFLPSTPLHHLLLSQLKLPVVATSGNRGGEPIVTDEHEATSQLDGIADAFLVHDRPIVRRVDDSVVRVIAGQAVTFRLARGYAPLPLPALETVACSPVLAVGGHQKVALAAWSGAQAVLAQHVGDLDDAESRLAFAGTVEDLQCLYRFDPATIACDLHPDYFSTRWAMTRGKPLVQVQHHHAHALACMVEHGLRDREVLAFAWDGTGHGTDGTVWGGEALKAGWNGLERVASLLPFPLPGGEAAIRQPGRAAFGVLSLALGPETMLEDGRLHKRLGLAASQAGVLTSMVRRGVNTPWTSSVGRLFDAVAALVLGVHEVSYEGEAAVWLEAVADPAVTDAYEMPLRSPGECMVAAGDAAIARGDWRPMILAMLKDMAADVEPGIIAARFHNALAGWAGAVARHAPHLDIVLCGGCFQNRLLTERCLDMIRASGRRVYFPGQVPPGDGGLAVGQLAAAMAKVNQGGAH